MNLPILQQKLSTCRECRTLFGFEPNPIVWGTAQASIVLIGQAPSRKVHETGIPFNDASGKRLRRWLGVDEDAFWNQDTFYITAVGHCYPGSAGRKGGGDSPPPRICSELWLGNELEILKPELYLMIGSHAARYCFGKNKKLTELVFEELQYKGKPAFVLPHPSPLNRKWFKDHPSFEDIVVPGLQQVVEKVLNSR
jgi:uracil-DNA glycosylase family 4